MKVPFLLVTVAVAVTPMIAAAFLWPATWSMIWRQVSISLWGIGVIFTIERLVGGRPTGQTPAALDAVSARTPVVRIALIAALAMLLGPPVLAVATGAPWSLQPGWFCSLPESSW